MSICHVGTSSFHTPHRDFSFNKVLHVPDSTKNLISVHQFTTDNDVYLEFHLLALLKYPFYPLFILDNGMNLISKSLTVLTPA